MNVEENNMENNSVIAALMSGDVKQVHLEKVNEEIRRLDEIRQISNIIQALENLNSQCANLDSFNHIRSFSKQALQYSQQQLRRHIHQD